MEKIMAHGAGLHEHLTGFGEMRDAHTSNERLTVRDKVGDLISRFCAVRKTRILVAPRCSTHPQFVHDDAALLRIVPSSKGGVDIAAHLVKHRLMPMRRVPPFGGAFLLPE
jgi:hypothetical protein